MMKIIKSFETYDYLISQSGSELNFKQILMIMPLSVLIKRYLDGNYTY